MPFDQEQEAVCEETARADCSAVLLFSTLFMILYGVCYLLFTRPELFCFVHNEPELVEVVILGMDVPTRDQFIFFIFNLKCDQKRIY